LQANLEKNSMNKRRASPNRKKLQKLFTAIFMLSSLDPTLTTIALDQVVRSARLQARRDTARLKLKRTNQIDYDVLGHLIYYWQHSPKYLNESGNPFPIPAKGDAPSIEALLRKLKIKTPFKIVLADLKAMRRVRVSRTGLYLPRADATIIPTLTPEVVATLTQTIHHLVATVFANTSIRNRRGIKLVERSASVPDLPKSKIADFKVFVREQTGGFLETVNDWLENERGRDARMPNAPGRSAAGLHVFAFVGKRDAD
jgi:Family of unknown function (DUF6502)